METLPEYIARAVLLASIGSIDIKILPDQSYWLENANGEGTQVSEQRLAEELEDVFNRLM